MKRGDVLRQERLKHLEELRQLEVHPYPATTKRTDTVAEALAKLGQTVAIAGRIVAIRSHGRAVFLDILDETGKMQVYLKEDELADREFRVIELSDTGDFLAIQGTVFVTKLGEMTVHAKSLQFLAKAVRPMPTEWQGLKDSEERFRKRFIDLHVNPEVRRLLALRAQIIRETRRFMDEHGFNEVETPTLQPIYGGASARPFTTRYNAYDTDVFLKIAPELYLKRLLVGGYEKVYEMSRNFRNEGADPTHNPEFLELEFYAAYWDDEMLMAYIEDLVIGIVTAVLGKPELTINGQTIHLRKPFARTTFAELTKGSMADESFKTGVKKILEPTFVRFTPRYLVPLAKAHNQELAQSFQFVMGGVELAKAFAELNDPLEQRQQFELQAQGRAGGDEEAQPLDEEFLEALEYGMPPAAGFGMGMERFIAMVAGQDTLRQTMYFPFMKPRSSNTSELEKGDR